MECFVGPTPPEEETAASAVCQPPPRKRTASPHDTQVELRFRTKVFHVFDKPEAESMEKFGNYIQKSHGSILALRSRWKRGKKTVHEGEALPFRSQQQSLRATALLNRPAEGANMTRRPGLAHLHGEERWRWPLR